MRHDTHAAGVQAGPELTAELRRLANLFLVASVTLALFFLRTVAAVLAVSFISQTVAVIWSVALLSGWAASWALGVYTTYRARRWAWLALCAVPFTCVPASVAYAWIRRREIEDEVLGDHGTARQKSARGSRD
jgi:hypothetical protein